MYIYIYIYIYKLILCDRTDVPPHNLNILLRALVHYKQTKSGRGVDFWGKGLAENRC